MKVAIATLNHQYMVIAVALSFDGKTIATASCDKTVLVWNKETEKAIATLNHQDKVIAVGFNCDHSLTLPENKALEFSHILIAYFNNLFAVIFSQKLTHFRSQCNNSSSESQNISWFLRVLMLSGFPSFSYRLRVLMLTL
ncbi:WD-40 repeat [Trichodesmium erythraeum IMS101]|uniref:WD-40 repeat n=2 Tax=Trichodesmium erythraeum TaxID=1206 RepID=Q119F0_TRIEI